MRGCWEGSGLMVATSVVTADSELKMEVFPQYMLSAIKDCSIPVDFQIQDAKSIETLFVT